SARGTNAATLSTTPTSTAPDRTNNSTISNACSPVSGCDTNNCSTSTPNAAAYTGSKACSASTNAATPPPRCASATTCKAKVVFPPDSGPYTSPTRPRGNPPTPNARSTLNDPVATTPAPNTPAGSAPNRMIAPLPNCLSIAETAALNAFLRGSSMVATTSIRLTAGRLLVQEPAHLRAAAAPLAGASRLRQGDFTSGSCRATRSVEPLTLRGPEEEVQTSEGGSLA